MRVSAGRRYGTGDQMQPKENSSSALRYNAVDSRRPRPTALRPVGNANLAARQKSLPCGPSRSRLLPGQ